jgi:hypothetical protein
LRALERRGRRSGRDLHFHSVIHIVTDGELEDRDDRAWEAWQEEQWDWYLHDD